MSLIKIKFLEDGKWGDHPSDPIFDVVAGEERYVSFNLAKTATDAGKAEFVRAKKKPGPKAKGEGGKTGPKAKGETTGPRVNAEV